MDIDGILFHDFILTLYLFFFGFRRGVNEIFILLGCYAE
jgi:hypothetical protein